MKFPAQSLALVVLGCTSCAQAQAQNLTQALASNPDLSNLTTYFEPYLGQLAGLSNITLLAPNNAAFTEFLNSSAADALVTQPDLVQAILVRYRLLLPTRTQTHLLSVLSYTQWHL